MKVGDVVYREVRSAPRLGPVFEKMTITKVGRKWAQTDRYGVRVNIDKMTFDTGGYSCAGGKVWLSREEYEREAALGKAWDAFCMSIRETRRPPCLTLDKIAEARRALGMGESDGPAS